MAETETFVPKPARTPGRIRYDFEAGIMTERASDKRVIWIPEDFMQAVHAVSERVLRGDAPTMLSQAGRYWGETMFAQLEKRLQAERADLDRVEDLSGPDFTTMVDQVWSEYGLGRFEFTDTDNLSRLNLYHSYVAQVVPHTGKPVCHLYAGLYAGLFSVFFQRNLHCAEIMCLSSGDDYCQFHLGDQATVMAIQDQQAQGKTYEEISTLLRRGEKATEA